MRLACVFTAEAAVPQVGTALFRHPLREGDSGCGHVACILGPSEKGRGGPPCHHGWKRNAVPPPVAPCCGAHTMRPTCTVTPTPGKQPSGRRVGLIDIAPCHDSDSYPGAPIAMVFHTFGIITFVVSSAGLRQGSRNRSVRWRPDSHSTLSPGSLHFPVSPPPARKIEPTPFPKGLAAAARAERRRTRGAIAMCKATAASFPNLCFDSALYGPEMPDLSHSTRDGNRRARLSVPAVER